MKQSKIQQLATPILEGMEALANLVTTDLKDEFVAPLFDLTKRMMKATTGIEAPLKAKVASLVAEHGKKITDAGTKTFDLAGWRMEVRPTGGGFDRDAFFSLLRRKKIEKSEACDREVIYTPNKDLINQLIGAGKLKQSDVDGCVKEGGFAVQTPTKLEVDDE